MASSFASIATDGPLVLAIGVSALAGLVSDLFFGGLGAVQTRRPAPFPTPKTNEATTP